MYRVVNVDNEVFEQLLVPKPYVSKVLYLAHSHVLGAAGFSGLASREPSRIIAATVPSVKKLSPR